MTDSRKITNLYLYGQDTTPSNLEDVQLIRPTSPANNAVFGANINSFMQSGGGRFALMSNFEFIEDFFTESITLFTSHQEFEYGEAMSKAFVAEVVFGYNYYGWEMVQSDFRDSVNDYGERVYIYQTMEFEVLDEAQFIIEANGARRIENFAIQPRNDITENFDFDGGFLSNLFNGQLKAAIDPSSIGRTVNINFTGNRTTETLTSQDFLNRQLQDINTMSNWDGFDPTQLNSDVANIASDLWSNGVTKFLSGSKPILYGTVESDIIDGNDVLGSTWADLNGVPTIDDSAYANQGRVIIAAAGDDHIIGTAGDDSLLGGAGDDTFYFQQAYGNDTVNGAGGDVRDNILIDGQLLSGEAVRETGASGAYTLQTATGSAEITHDSSTQQLTITTANGEITVQDWVDGDYGIRLTESDDPSNSGDEDGILPNGLGGAVGAVADMMDNPPTSPLVLDLDGDGVELVSLAASSAYFDVNEDGFAERTGWVSGDDGLLAIDNGVVNRADAQWLKAA